MLQRAGEVSAPLIAEAAERLGLDLHADDHLALRILSDLASRLYAAGSRDATAETIAQFIEQLPPGANVNLESPTVVPEGPLGDFDLA